MKCNKGLLDILAEKAGCMYLSDLRQPHVNSILIHSLREIDSSAFGLREWNEAAEYLTGKNCSFESREEVKKYILDASLGKKFRS